MTEQAPTPKRMPAAPFYAGLLLMVLASFAFLEGSPPNPEERCEELGGEWLYGSEDLTCITREGEWLVFDAGRSEFVLPGQVSDEAASVTLLAAPVETVSGVTSISCSGVEEDYQVADVSSARPEKPDFSTWPDAVKYRTAITKDVARGVNFAGHYVVASWGCPDFRGCEGHAVVDALDGRIVSYGLQSSSETDYDRNSRLFTLKRKEPAEYLLNEESRTLSRCE